MAERCADCGGDFGRPTDRTTAPGAELCRPCADARDARLGVKVPW